jgi:hypothetical protein
MAEDESAAEGAKPTENKVMFRATAKPNTLTL